MSCRVYSSTYFDSIEYRVEIPPVSEIMQGITQVLNRVKAKSDQQKPSVHSASVAKRWKGKFQAPSSDLDEMDMAGGGGPEEQDLSYETVGKKPNAVFMRQRSDVAMHHPPERKHAMPVTKESKFASTQPRPSVRKSQKVQTEKEVNIILHGITDKIYEPNAIRMEKLLSGIESEEEKKSADVYILNTVVSLACKQLLYARSYALLLSMLDTHMTDTKAKLDKLTSSKFELLTTLDTEKRMTKMSCKSFAVFYTFLVTTNMAPLDKAVVILNDLLSYFETYEDIGDLAVEFICTFLCTLKKDGEAVFLQPFETLLSRLKPHFKKTSLSAMRLLDVKDCFSL